MTTTSAQAGKAEKMKSTKLGVMMLLGATSLSATDKQAFAYTVQVCAGPTLGHPALPRAQTITAGMFAGIGIKVEWIDVRACPPGVIHISISSPASRIGAPGMLAYALPYEGTQVVIFYDRVEQTVEHPKVPALLAHVMAHEVTHILEGLNYHSAEGLMKAHGTPATAPKWPGSHCRFLRKTWISSIAV